LYERNEIDAKIPISACSSGLLRCPLSEAYAFRPKLLKKMTKPPVIQKDKAKTPGDAQGQEVLLKLAGF